MRSKKAIVCRPPEIVFIENTNVCNLKCSMCPFKDMTREKRSMTLDSFKILADQIKQWKETRLNFYFFGESFVNKEAMNMIAYSKSIGLKIEFSTNLLLLNEGEIKTFMSLLDNNDSVTLSLDAFGEEEYKKMRVGGNYKKLMDNFEFIIREQIVKESKPVILAQGIYNWIPETFGAKGLLDENKKGMVESFINTILNKVWTLIGKDFTQDDIQNYTDQYYVRYLSGKLTKEIDKNIFFYVKDVDDWAAQMGARSKLKQIGSHQEYCDFPWKMMIVQVNGDVTVCCKDVNGTINIGNAFETSLQEIWNGEKMQQLRKDFISFKKENICRYC